MMISRSPHSSLLARPRRRPRKRRCKRSWRPALRRWATRVLRARDRQRLAISARIRNLYEINSCRRRAVRLRFRWSIVMRSSNWTPSIVPSSDDQDACLVVDDFGRRGRAYCETDVEATDLETVTIATFNRINVIVRKARAIVLRHRLPNLLFLVSARQPC